MASTTEVEMPEASTKKAPVQRSFIIFETSYHLMAERCRLLRAALNNGIMFSLPDFAPGSCHFLEQETQPQPDDTVEDCESSERAQDFDPRRKKYVRLSMVERDITFSLYLK